MTTSAGSAANTTNPESSCPPEEQLLGYADGTLRGEREAIERHVAGCDLCLDRVGDALGAVRVLEGAMLVSPPPEWERRAWAPGAAEASRWRTAPPLIERILGGVFSYRAAAVLATASLVAIAVISTGGGDRRPAGEAPVWRDAGRPEATVAPVPRAPAGDVIVGDGLRFAWEPVPGAARSVITIVDAGSGEMVVREAVGEAGYTLSSERALALEGHPLEWMIECTAEAGRSLESVATPFRVLAAPEGD